MIKLIESLDRVVAKIEFAMLIALITALTLILCAQVVLRYLFNSPLFWAEEVAVQILISATFIGVSYLTFSDSLVRVDFILDHLGRFWHNLMVFVLRLVGLATLLVFCFYATEWIMRPEIRSDISPTTGLPRWYNYAVLVGAFYCMAWHMLIKVILFRPHNGPVTGEVDSADSARSGGEA